MDELTLALLAIGIAILIVAIAGCVVWCRRRCKLRGEYVRLDENDYDFDVPETAINMSADAHGGRTQISFLQSKKMWVGGANPTDVREPAKTDPIDYKALQRMDDERSERNAQFALSCANYCRSLPHTRQVHTPLPNIGHRDTQKYYALATDALINRSLKRTVAALLSLTSVTVPSANGPAPALPFIAHFDRPATQQRIRSILLSITHPYILPTLDFGVAIAHNSAATAASSVLPSATLPTAAGAAAVGERYNVFIVREYSDSGSLRDYVHDTQPALQYRLKYCQPNPDPHTLTYPVKDTRPARIKYISRYGRQILLALQYFESIGYPYFALHTGNVILRDGVAMITDYENALFGLPHRLANNLRQLCRTCAVTNLDPRIAAFGALIYELASGSELLPAALTRDAETGSIWQFGLHAEYKAIDHVLQRIFNGTVTTSTSGSGSDTKSKSDASTTASATGPITISALLELPVFGGELKTPAAIPPTPEIMTDSKTTKLLNPLRKFYETQFADSTPTPRRSSEQKSKSAAASASTASATASGGSVAIDIKPSAGSTKKSKSLSKSAPSASASTASKSKSRKQ